MKKQPRKKKKQNILERFLNRSKGKDICVKSNKIMIFHDNYLERTTGIPFEEAMVLEDFTFADFLHSLFVSYPEIPKRVPPGKLGFLLNGIKPETFNTLKDGDRVDLVVMEEFKLTRDQIEATQREIEMEILNLIEKYKINITLDKIKEIIFNERDLKDFHSVIDIFSEKIENLDEANQVLNILMKAWNYFPYKSLNGFCPLEKISEFQKKIIHILRKNKKLSGTKNLKNNQN